jgi:hypothetical protein
LVASGYRHTCGEAAQFFLPSNWDAAAVDCGASAVTVVVGLAVGCGASAVTAVVGLAVGCGASAVTAVAGIEAITGDINVLVGAAAPTFFKRTAL